MKPIPASEAIPSTLKQLALVYEERRIYVLLDPDGIEWQSSAVRQLQGEGKALLFEPKTARGLMRAVLEGPRDQAFFVRLGAGLSRKNLRELCGAIETLKDGVAYRLAKKFVKVRFERPTILVFAAKLPDREWLAPSDKWVFGRFRDASLRWGSDF